MRCRERVLPTVLVALPLLLVAAPSSADPLAVGPPAASAGLVTAAPIQAGTSLEVVLSPRSGPAGSRVMVAFSSGEGRCGEVSIFWRGPDGPLLRTVPEKRGEVIVRVPDSARPGAYLLYARNECGVAGMAPFKVRPALERAEAPRPTPTRSEPAPTPSGALSWSPAPRPDAATPGHRAAPEAGPTTPRPWPSASSGALTLDRDNVHPGVPLTASGTGCDPGAQVTITSGEEQLGTTYADSTGSFVAPVVFGEIEPGRRVITASCGAVLTSQVELRVVSSSSGTAATVVVIVFFLLVAAALLRWQFRPVARKGR